MYIDSGTTMPVEKITTDKHILGGIPVVAGTRIPVVVVLATLAECGAESEVMRQLPKLKDGDVSACLEYAIEKLLKETK